MRKILLLLFLILTFSAFSQNADKVIVLKDAETNLPIEDATVYVSKTRQTLLSNTEGVVNFSLNGGSTIQITHASYAAMTIRSTILKETRTEIFLKNSVTGLDEIIVTKQHPQKILKAIVENSIKKLTVPARLKVYTREFFKLNGIYSYYNDGLMNFQLFGKENNFKSNILVEQNRSLGLVNEEISSDVLGYNLNNIMENYYNFKYLNPLLESDAKKEYDFVIKAYSTNKDYNVMLVTPLDTAKGMLDDFKIIYDYKRKIIIEVSSFVSPMTIANVKEKTSVGSRNIYKSIFKNMYRWDNSNYYLVSSKEEIGFERVDKDKKTNIEVRNYFITTNFSNHNFTYKDTDVFKDKTLYNKKNTVLSNYWETSGLTATDEELQIINTIGDREN